MVQELVRAADVLDAEVGATLAVGGTTYDLAIDGEWAWAASPQDDAAITAAMRDAQSVVVTGRGGGPALREVMDTVSEVKEIKHAYRAGIRARQGVDY